MEQYRPEFTVGKGEQRSRTGFTRYEEIDRPVSDSEVHGVIEYARKMGLWRFEENVLLRNPTMW